MDNQYWSNSETSASDYEVFINFRGEDTRDSLINVLKIFMEQDGIRYFYDDESVRTGDVLSKKLIESIERSQVYLVVLSERYAESKWCLRELAHMVKCYQEESKYGRKVILPVFYGVSVETVKLEGGSAYKTDMKKLCVEPKELGDWEEALKKVPNFKVLHKGTMGLGDLAQMIVREVQLKLQMRPLRYHMVGIDEQAQKVEDKLDVGSGDVRFLVIYGEQGIGKTALARAVFQKLSSRFQGSSFIADVTEMEKHYSYLYLKHKLLRDICGHESKDDWPLDIKKSFRDKEVLIVLDGVDHWGQIEVLAGSSTWFGPGSRIIITSSCLEVGFAHSDMHECNSNPAREFRDYEMNKMKFREASKLFNRYAFWQDSALEVYKSTSRRIVQYSDGLPLILEIMGSLLHRNRSRREWNEIAEKLQNSRSIREKLMISYSKLQHSAQKIFLDIACFFVNEGKIYPEYMWNDDEDAEAIKALRTLSLVKIIDGNRLWMHDSLRDLGRDIVLQNSALPARCRFWEHKEALQVLEYAEGEQKVEAIWSHHYERPIEITPVEFSRMPKLRFFRMCFVNFKGDFRNSLRELRWLSWHYSPEVFEAKHFASAALVILDLARGRITAEWDGWKQLEEENNLKVIDLTGCKELTRTPRFSQFMDLERVILEDCTELVEIDSSIGELNGLKYLNVRGCDSLVGLPEQICLLKKLEEIHIMKKEHGRFNLPSDIGSLKSLTTLEIVNVEMDAIPPSIGSLEKLQRLSLLRCSGFEKLPESVGDLSSLIELQISETKLMRLPDSIGSLKELKVIKMEGSSIMRLPPDIIKAEKLEEIHGKNSVLLAGEIPNGIEELCHLKVLDLSNTYVCKLPETISELSHLKKLQLPQCCKLQNLPNLPGSLTTLGITFEALHNVQNPLNGLTKLEKLELHIPENTVCDNPLQLPTQLTQLKSLHLSCQDLERCVDVELPRNLSKLTLKNAVLRTTLQHFNNLKNLSSLELHGCLFEDNNINAGSIRPENDEAAIFVNLKTLKHFYASGCQFRITNGLRLPKDLRMLHIDGCSFHGKVLQLSGLKSLKQLKIFKCKDLDDVEGLGELESLEELRIEDCSSLKRLAGDTSKSKRLQVLSVVHNDELEEIELLDEAFRKKLKFCALTGRKLRSNRRSSSMTNTSSSRSGMEGGD